MMKTHDRRRHHRHNIGIRAKLVTPTATIPVYAKDISVQGIRITSSELVLPETEVVLNLPFQDETLLSGIVLWTMESAEADALHFEIGIEIHAVILREMEAIGLADRAVLVNEIASRTNPD